MDNDLLLDQFQRLLVKLPDNGPWPMLAESGFLDLLRAETDGGAGLMLEELFPLALAVGARPTPPPIIETMLARLVDRTAANVADAEGALLAGQVPPPVARALAAAAAAAQMAGAMEAVQALTIDYSATRQQFGRSIAKFQAVQHQIAVMAEEVMAARIAAEAAFTGAALAISPQRAAVAKARAGKAAEQVCAIAHAVHGAIGISEEYVLHGYTRRLHRQRMQHGGESYWAQQLGAWVLASDAGFATLARLL